MVKKDGNHVNVAYIVLELIPGGELFDYVANSGPFSERIIKYFSKQILLIVQYIHSKGLFHRDLKLENILLDESYDIKIIDFGVAQYVNNTGTNRTKVGTLGYMAPEVLAHQPYKGQLVDIFSLGVLFFILYTGHPPFSMAD